MSQQSPQGCTDINDCRTVSNVVWSCLATIFACTWVSLHPNVPGNARSAWSLPIQKTKLALIAIIAPEVIAMWALRQWMVARLFSKETLLPMEHGFFLSMGGFVRCTYSGPQIVTPASALGKSFDETSLSGSTTSINFTPDDHASSINVSLPLTISSFNHRDWLEPAPVSPLPSLALSSPTLLPPLPQPLTSQHLISNVKLEDITDRSKGDATAKGLAILQTTWFMVQCAARTAQGLHVTELELVTVAFALINLVIYVLWWKKPLDVRRPILLDRDQVRTHLPDTHADSEEHTWSSAIGRMFRSVFGFQDEVKGNAVPMLWSGFVDTTSARLTLLATLYLIAAVFGGVHSLAWNFPFPTPAEKYLWRTSSIMMVVAPVLLFCAHGSAMTFRPGHWLYRVLKVMPGHHIVFLLQAQIYLGVFLYVPARIFLLVLPFTTLRALPPSAYQSVEWLKFAPHFS